MRIRLVLLLCAIQQAVAWVTVPSTTFGRARMYYPKAAAAVIPSSGAGTQQQVDVAVVGAGPVGTLMVRTRICDFVGVAITQAALLAQQRNLKVALIDPKLDKRWLPNYGVWMHEWKDLEQILGFSVEHCLMRAWPVTDVFFGGSHGMPMGERTRVNHAYGRVDRAALKQELLSRAEAGGAVLLKTSVDPSSVHHTDTGSVFTCLDGTHMHAKMMVDCSGFASKLVKLDGDLQPGVQIAYGMDCVVDKCPYDTEAMTMMDYRTDYVSEAADQELLEREPTFIYAMPMRKREGGGEEGYDVFFEETSLVARPPMTFEECKRRLYMRLEHLGVKVLSVEEEEFCYIPMGGSLPIADQRVVAMGGAASMTHPATGYHLCRALASTGPAAEAVGRELSKDSFDPDAASRAVYNTIWNQKTRQQRDFALWGGEFLMRQGAENLRGFFQAFFRLPEEYWMGFLSGWPGLTHNTYHETWRSRLVYGLRFFLLAPIKLKLALASAAIIYFDYPFFRSVTPLAELDGG